MIITRTKKKITVGNLLKKRTKPRKSTPREQKPVSAVAMVEKTEVPVAKKINTERSMALVPVDPQALLSQAIEKGLPLESMERLLAMRRELKAEWARERFFEDLSKFQAACPIIGKSQGVNDKSGKLRYRFAPLDEIVAQVKKSLEKYGFSYTIITKQTDRAVTAICNAHHIDGHTESSDFTIPIDPEAYMNDAQKIASAMTYATRYSFRNAFGIVTGDADDDGNGSGDPEKKKPDLRPPQARPVNPEAAIPESVIRIVEDPPASPESSAYVEIIHHINAKEKSREGPMISLFASAERVYWKAKADKARANPEELISLLQELNTISDERKTKIKEEI